MRQLAAINSKQEWQSTPEPLAVQLCLSSDGTTHVSHDVYKERWRVIYGLQSHDHTDHLEALDEFASCLTHALDCEANTAWLTE